MRARPRPDLRLGTLQIGQPAWIAERTGLPVVADLRVRDVAAGGQGAPLVSVFDTLLLSGGKPRAALNLGGIANITVVGAGTDPIAFDTGPANALLDAVVAEATGGARRYDADGAGAAAGTGHEGLLVTLLAEPYYAAPPPKTTGKELFNLAYVHQAVATCGEISHIEKSPTNIVRPPTRPRTRQPMTQTHQPPYPTPPTHRSPHASYLAFLFHIRRCRFI